MTRMPRLLPLIAVAIGGVLAVNALAGARSLPELLSSARAFAEEAVGKPDKAAKGEKAEAAEGKPGETPKAQSSLPGGAIVGAAAAPPAAPVCALSATELAKEAGLSPAELQMLQSLGARRGQLDQRETDIDLQLKLLAAAEAKLDAKLAALNLLKTDITGLLGQADAQSQAELVRMVKVYETMAPKKSAPAMAILSDEVRLPIAAKMKEAKLSAVLAAMSPQQARDLTEKLQRRLAAASVNAAKAAVTPPAAPAAAKPTAQAAAPAAAAKPKPA